MICTGYDYDAYSKSCISYYRVIVRCCDRYYDLIDLFLIVFP